MGHCLPTDAPHHVKTVRDIVHHCGSARLVSVASRSGASRQNTDGSIVSRPDLCGGAANVCRMEIAA